jgi:nitrate/TMAO reductase-like tetraheme cytochrome c subunit
MAETCANRTHPGRSSRPTLVLKTRGTTRGRPPPSGHCPEPLRVVSNGRERAKVRGPSASSQIAATRTGKMAPMVSTEDAIPAGPAEQPVRARRARTPRHIWTWTIGGIVAVLALLSLFVWAAVITDQPDFCGTCHEMGPYVASWAEGPHKDVWCVDCHVGEGYPARFAHKFIALQEVVAHVKGDTTFPRPAAAHVADKDCRACHAQVKPKLAASGFDHTVHESKATCQVCHADSGHDVTESALTAAGIFNPNVRRAVPASSTAAVGRGSANVPGHMQIGCTRCHDLEKTGCAACHSVQAGHFKPASGALPACPLCHSTSSSWVFTHPTQTDCQNCHTPSAKHFKPANGTLTPCSRCHKEVASTWAFTHPAQADCQTCHAPSAKHFKPATGSLTPCSRCHKQAGKTWAFKHPGTAADCTTCHAVPTKHFMPVSGQLKPCAQCHAQVGVSWAYKHPGSGSDCRGCHAAPAGHPAGQCNRCHHKTGVSFAFSHPSTRAPHGTSGIACNRCHPNGYTTNSCTCH